MIKTIKFYFRLLRQHLRCGHHSGFPWCCTIFYSLFIGHHGDPFTSRRGRYRAWALNYPTVMPVELKFGDQPLTVDMPFTGPGFVPCPLHRLLKTRYRLLLECDCKPLYLLEEWPPVSATLEQLCCHDAANGFDCDCGE
jgi:hypothetical protein